MIQHETTHREQPYKENMIWYANTGAERSCVRMRVLSALEVLRYEYGRDGSDMMNAAVARSIARRRGNMKASAVGRQ